MVENEKGKGRKRRREKGKGEGSEREPLQCGRSRSQAGRHGQEHCGSTSDFRIPSSPQRVTRRSQERILLRFGSYGDILFRSIRRLLGICCRQLPHTMRRCSAGELEQ
jgi:hypothetical protein